MSGFNESAVEEAALAWLGDAGWSVLLGPDIAPGEVCAERNAYGQVVLEGRLRAALERLNPELPAEALEEALRKVLRPAGAEVVARNRVLHRWLVDGVTVEFRSGEGEIRGAQVRLLDFEESDANDLVAVNQFTVVESRTTGALMWCCS